MLIRIALMTLAIASSGHLAMAQDAAPMPEPTAREITNARAQADRIIARGGDAARYFENITDSTTATVRHKPSGMTCAFYGETDYDFIRLFPEQPGGPRTGDDAMCNIRTTEMDFSSYATRYRSRLTPEFVLEDARRAIEARFPDARPYEGPLASARTEGDSPPLIAAYNVTVEGKPKATYVLVSHCGDWSFKARTTSGSEDVMAANLLVSLTFLQALPSERR